MMQFLINLSFIGLLIGSLLLLSSEARQYGLRIIVICLAVIVIDFIWFYVKMDRFYFIAYGSEYSRFPLLWNAFGLVKR